MSAHTAPDEAVRRAIELAGHAPSLYNARPWSWEVSDAGLDLFLEDAGSFPVTDPDQREMRIGCGAALDHLQVALAAAGWRCEIEPSSGQKDGLLAQVRLTEIGQVDEATLRLAESIEHRHNDRRPFAPDPVSDEALAALQASAAGDGVHLQIVTRDEHRVWLSVLSERAGMLQSAQDGYADELRRATGPHDHGGNIAADAVPHVVSPRHTDVTLRDFELVAPGTLEIPESVDEHPVWGILWTDGDGDVDWLLAGRALSRLLLHATQRGLATGIQSQPVEVPMIRAQINEHLLTGLGHAQVLIRIGWPGTTDS